MIASSSLAQREDFIRRITLLDGIEAVDVSNQLRTLNVLFQREVAGQRGSAELHSLVLSQRTWHESLGDDDPVASLGDEGPDEVLGGTLLLGLLALRSASRSRVSFDLSASGSVENQDGSPESAIVAGVGDIGWAKWQPVQWRNTELRISQCAATHNL
jgi:hypothetical protein